MSFNNLLLALALTVMWPLVLMGVLAAAEWLERRTLTAREIVPSGPRPAAAAPPEPIQVALGGTAGADGGMAASWAGAGSGSPAGARGDTPAGSPGGTLSPEAFGGADAGDGERVAARRAVGGRGRHLRRGGGGRHERRG
jgi:hypothetical protein